MAVGVAIGSHDDVMAWLHMTIATEFPPKFPMGFVEPLTVAEHVLFIPV